MKISNGINLPLRTYALIDSGDGEKLELFGEFILRRPDPEALWRRAFSQKEWSAANLSFIKKGDKGGVWEGDAPKEWQLSHGGFTFLIKPTSFKHVGLFPEQVANWDFIAKSCAGKKAKVLNLFAYTGGATLAAAKAGAEVTHVDASKPVVEWARKNAELNNLQDAPIRWIVDDVLVFVKREVKRGNKYDGIIMDPPAFGHGPKDELWKIERDFLPLLDECQKLLSDEPLFVIVSGYASGYSGVAFENCLIPIAKKYGGTTESTELLIKEKTGHGASLPAGVTARWWNDR